MKYEEIQKIKQNTTIVAIVFSVAVVRCFQVTGSKFPHKRLQMVYIVTWYIEFTKRFCAFRMSYVAQYRRKCNFIYVCNKSAAFPAPIFTKPINTQQHYTQIA